MKIIRLAAVILCCILMCGCWDSIPIEECAHPVIGGYDVPKDGKKGVTVTGIYYQSLAGEPVSAEIISLTERSVGETRQKRAGYNFESWSTSMLNALIYGEDLASKGLWPYIDIMYRSPGSSATIKLAVADGRADGILTESSPEENVRAAYITNVILTANEKNLLPSMDIVGFVKDYYTPGCNSVLPVISMDPEGKPVLSGGAVLKKDVMVGKLDYAQANTYMMLREAKGSGILVYDCELRGQQCRVTVLCGISRHIDTKQENGKMRFAIKLSLNAQIMEISAPENIAPSINELELLSEALNRSVQERAEKYFEYTHKELGLDNIGLAREALVKDRKRAEEYDTEEFWRSAETVISVKSDIEAFTP